MARARIMRRDALISQASDISRDKRAEKKSPVQQYQWACDAIISKALGALTYRGGGIGQAFTHFSSLRGMGAKEKDASAAESA